MKLRLTGSITLLNIPELYLVDTLLMADFHLNNPCSMDRHNQLAKRNIFQFAFDFP